MPHDVSVGGPTLAAHAIRAGLVDEIQLFVVPIVIGGGKRVLPSYVSVKLDLRDERALVRTIHGFDALLVLTGSTASAIL